ncbi:MAG: CPBP family intramembrane glutamic endopeptidase [Nanoarchaeota archaeon]
MKVKQYIDIFLKIFLLIIGIADFAGILPPSLDLLDKILTSLILFYFWVKLKPLKFMLGYDSNILDKLVILVFYVFVIDTFLPFIPGISEELGFKISLYSIYIGTLAIASIALFVSFKRIERKSLFHSFFSVIDREDRLFDNLMMKRLFLVKFILFFLVMIFTSQYFFGLVNQWFIVSLDKSLLLLAFLFAVKDFSHTKSKALNTLGNFDEWLLNTITEIFTNRKKFYLGFGLLLIFHYLSDLAVFFIPYLLPIAKDPYYFNLIGNPEFHSSLRELVANESLFRGIDIFAANLTYIFSSIGILLIFLIPIILIFLIVLKKDIKTLINIKGSKFLLAMAFSSISLFLLSMWTLPKVILSGHVVGVDFITQKISSISHLDFLALFAIFMIILTIVLSLKKQGAETAWLLVFFVSIAYLSVYSIYYFISLSNYYIFNLIPYFNSIGSHMMVFNSYFLLGLDLLFYIIGFVIFSYNAMRYIFRNLVSDILTNKFTIFTSLLIVIATMFIIELVRDMDFIQSFTILFSFLGTFLIFSYAFYKALEFKKESRDDFILAIGMIEFIYLGLGALVVLLSSNFDWNIGFMNYLVPFIITILAFIIAGFFRIRFSFRGILFRRLLFSLIIGLGFGLLFFLLGEPKIEIFTTYLPVVLLFIIFIGISEEVMFRLIIFKLGEKSFNFKTANMLQAVIFGLVHFLFIKDLFMYYGNTLMFLGYFIFLVVFGYVMGLIVGRAERGGERDILYAIIAHIVADLVIYLI